MRVYPLARMTERGKEKSAVSEETHGSSARTDFLSCARLMGRIGSRPQCLQMPCEIRGEI